MAKKFGKFLLTTAAIGAMAAGIYYYLQDKESLTDEDPDDDDFDNFDEDLDEESADRADDRNYVDLGLDKAKAETEESKVSQNANEKESTAEFQQGLHAAKAEAQDKIVGENKETSDKSGTQVEEFFDDENA